MHGILVHLNQAVSFVELQVLVVGMNSGLIFYLYLWSLPVFFVWGHPSLLNTIHSNPPPQNIPSVNVNKEHSSTGLCSPSGAGASIVWDRCNYSDNITEPALPAVLIQDGGGRLGLGNAATLLCPSLPPPFFLFTLIFYFIFCPCPYMNSFLRSYPLVKEHISVVCKAEFVPV